MKSPKQAVAVYPGSFDPVTNGHLDIIRRCSRIFSRVVVAILRNPRKEALFSTEDRLAMLRAELAGDDGVEVTAFDGLLVNFVRDQGAQVIIRGLRAVSDFEFEFQMALMNRRLASGIETLFMVPHQDYEFLSSSLIKEIYSLGGGVDGLVPKGVEERLREHYRSSGD